MFLLFSERRTGAPRIVRVAFWVLTASCAVRAANLAISALLGYRLTNGVVSFAIVCVIVSFGAALAMRLGSGVARYAVVFFILFAAVPAGLAYAVVLIASLVSIVGAVLTWTPSARGYFAKRPSLKQPDFRRRF